MRVLHDSRRWRCVFMILAFMAVGMMQAAAGPMKVSTDDDGLWQTTQTFVTRSAYEETPRMFVDGEHVAINLAEHSIEEAEEIAGAGMSARRLMAIPASARENDTTSINVRVHTLKANNCSRLQDVTISQGDNPATAAGLIELEASNCGSSSVNVSITGAALAEISMVSSNVTDVYLNTSNLTTADFSNNAITSFEATTDCSGLSHLDLRNNRLGISGSTGARIGSVEWKTRTISGNNGTKYSKWGLDSLKYLNMSGNELVLSTPKNGGGGPGNVGSFRLGMGLSTSHHLAMKKYWYSSGAWTNGANSYLSISGTTVDGDKISLSSNHYNKKGQHFWFIGNNPAYEGSTISVSSTMEDAWNGHDMYIRLALFGDNLNTNRWKTSNP